ncbi:MAG: SCO family protein [Acidobacteria bacterium]|nr:SCO family protein [Acidobacteriota bacterium]
MKTLAAAVVLGLTVTASAWAQPPRFTGADVGGPPPGTSSELVPDILEKVGIDQKLNAQVPLDAAFRDEQGRQVSLGDYFGKRPVVLALVYYECPMLCTQVLNGAVAAFKVMNFTAGDEFEVVTVSFNPKETPAMASSKKTTYINKYGRPEAAAGWHFLTGDKPAIDALANAVGFRYVFDQASQQYVHASAIMVLTPQGRVSKYFYGIEYPPKDIRLGLIEASGGKIGNPVDQVLLYCYHYDPHSGKYSMVVMNVLRVAGVATVGTIVGFVGLMWSRDRRKSKYAAAVSPSGPR